MIYDSCLTPVEPKRTRNHHKFAIVRIGTNPISITVLSKRYTSVTVNCYTKQAYRNRGFAKLATKTALQDFKISKKITVAAHTEPMSNIVKKVGWKSIY